MGKNFASDNLKDIFIKSTPNIEVEIWPPVVDLRCTIPPTHLSHLKVRAIYRLFKHFTKWARTLSLEILQDIWMESTPNIVDICHTAMVQNPTQAHMSLKGPTNTFHLNLKWARTLTLGILPEIFIEPATKYRGWHSTRYCELEVQNTTHTPPIKTWAIPFT